MGGLDKGVDRGLDRGLDRSLDRTLDRFLGRVYQGRTCAGREPWRRGCALSQAAAGRGKGGTFI